VGFEFPLVVFPQLDNRQYSSLVKHDQDGILLAPTGLFLRLVRKASKPSLRQIIVVQTWVNQKPESDLISPNISFPSAGFAARLRVLKRGPQAPSRYFLDSVGNVELLIQLKKEPTDGDLPHLISILDRRFWWSEFSGAYILIFWRPVFLQQSLPFSVRQAVLSMIQGAIGSRCSISRIRLVLMRLCLSLLEDELSFVDACEAFLCQVTEVIIDQKVS